MHVPVFLAFYISLRDETSEVQLFILLCHSFIHDLTLFAPADECFFRYGVTGYDRCEGHCRNLRHTHTPTQTCSALLNICHSGYRCNTKTFVEVLLRWLSKFHSELMTKNREDGNHR